MKKSALLASMLLVTISPCALAVETGFYAGANVLGIRQEAKKMGDSRLPGNEVVKKDRSIKMVLMDRLLRAINLMISFVWSWNMFFLSRNDMII